MKKTYSTIKFFVVLLSLASFKLGAQAYCTPTTGSVYDDEIFNVTFGTLNNTSNCSQTGGVGSVLNVYSNYTSIVSAPVVVQGLSYSFSVTAGQCGSYPYSGYIRAWIDYNQDGVFNTTNEQIFTSAYTQFAIAGTIINGGNITIPTGATPGVTRMRVTCMEGSQPSSCTSPYYGEVEDYNVQIITPTPCFAVPGANTVVAPSLSICPNSSTNLFLNTSYTVVGINYQWQSAPNSVGPFTSVSGATNTAFTTPSLTANTYYQVVITCANVTGTTNATVGSVLVSGVITSSVPYLEDFEGIQNNNKLPNCSWAASSIPGITQTYMNTMSQNRNARSGTKFASFYTYYLNGPQYFYSNGIQLYAGITYSGTVWYETEYYGYTNVSDLSLMYGTTQSSVGLVTIASHSPAASAVYKALTNTFSVPTSGVYYLAVRATGNGTYGQYLSWDDLSVTIPCSLNSSTVNLSVSSQTICSGDALILTAAGADTYSWNTGATGPVVTDMPLNSQMYTVMGTNTLTGCTTTVQSQMVTVNPSPIVIAYATNPVVCAGQLSNLVASNALTYTWSTASNNTVIAVNPTVTTSYIVIGENSYNCSNSATVTIQVNPLPLVTVTGPSGDAICKGETATLNGGGATTYAWASNASFIQSQQAMVSPNSTTTYTLNGTNANGCVGKTTYVLNVNECVGIKEITNTLNGVSVYPNPTTGIFTVELKNASAKTVQVTDLTGRVIMTANSTNEKINLNINNLASGIYYVKIQSNDAVDVIKVVKQ